MVSSPEPEWWISRPGCRLGTYDSSTTVDTTSATVGLQMGTGATFLSRMQHRRVVARIRHHIHADNPHTVSNTDATPTATSTATSRADSNVDRQHRFSRHRRRLNGDATPTNTAIKWRRRHRLIRRRHLHVTSTRHRRQRLQPHRRRGVHGQFERARSSVTNHRMSR